MDSTGFLIVSILAIAIQGFWFFLALFEPTLQYKISQRQSIPSSPQEFLRLLSVIVDARISYRNSIEVLKNGERFYKSELEAIRAARHSINLEAYIFQKGMVTRRFVEALTERAGAGVKVHLVLDAIGSFATWNPYFESFRNGGGRVEWYHPFRWHSWPRLNNRTHRNLLIVDGSVGFIGGAGFADHWLKNKGARPRWRDTMVRVEGEAVNSLQSAFAQNWLEASGKILCGNDYFPTVHVEEETLALVVSSSVSAGRSTRARMLFQMLVASARENIQITTPYFLPDKSVRSELIRAAKERGAQVVGLTAGKPNDHLLTRHASRRLYGDLLKAGVRIYEYRPTMIHTKAVIVDRLWSAVGSTNIDARSFGLNDEVNLVVLSEPVARRLHEDFVRDLTESRGISYDAWRRRSIRERLHEWRGWILERQQ